MLHMKHVCTLSQHMLHMHARTPAIFTRHRHRKCTYACDQRTHTPVTLAIGTPEPRSRGRRESWGAPTTGLKLLRTAAIRPANEHSHELRARAPSQRRAENAPLARGRRRRRRGDLSQRSGVDRRTNSRRQRARRAAPAARAQGPGLPGLEGAACFGGSGLLHVHLTCSAASSDSTITFSIATKSSSSHRRGSRTSQARASILAVFGRGSSAACFGFVSSSPVFIGV